MNTTNPFNPDVRQGEQTHPPTIERLQRTLCQLSTLSRDVSCLAYHADVTLRDNEGSSLGESKMPDDLASIAYHMEQELRLIEQNVERICNSLGISLPKPELAKLKGDR